MIFDCFTFFNELDLLEVRLRVLWDVVDYFVLCESPFTFRGRPKPLFFAESASRFAAWSSKIVPIVYPGPALTDPWQNEWRQRDHLIEALQEANANDLILLSDCDEIPDPSNAGRRPGSSKILGHRQRLSKGWVNRVHHLGWVGTRAVLRRDVAAYGGLSNVRKRPETDLEIVNGGWHFSSFGGSDVMATKIHSFAHSEVDVPYLTDSRRLEVAFYESESDVKWIALDDSFPALFHEPRWSSYVASAPSKIDAQTGLALEHAHGCFAYVPADARSVAVLAEDSSRIWARTGAERFGDAFLGVMRGALDLPRGVRGWVVIDSLERLTDEDVAALSKTSCGTVAYGRNARSFRVFQWVCDGGAFPPGPALGLAELRRRMQAIGGEPMRMDRIRSQEIFVVWSEVPEMLYTVALGGTLRFNEISRDDLHDFLTHAVIMTCAPRNGTG